MGHGVGHDNFATRVTTGNQTTPVQCRQQYHHIKINGANYVVDDNADNADGQPDDASATWATVPSKRGPRQLYEEGDGRQPDNASMTWATALL